MPPAKRDLRTLPVLEGWLSFPEAAQELGISRQRMHQLAEVLHPDGTPELTTASQIGTRPTYVIRTAEVRARKERRAAVRPVPAQAPAHLRAFPLPAGASSPAFDVGGVSVTADQLREAVGVLQATGCSRASFKQAMAKAGNPLAWSDYQGTARAYRAAHPGARALGTKQALLAAYRDQLAGEGCEPAA